MLQKLTIQNYAIIDELEIDFSSNLNVITGETGAGKSIIVGALGLILGQRADTTALVNKEKKCVIEGLFEIKNKKDIRKFLQDNDYESYQNNNSDELIIRREISVSGKSRAFINDTPVTLEQLQQLSSKLVDLHQQFDSIELGKSGFQREVVDALATTADVLASYQAVFQKWIQAKKEWEDLTFQKQQFDKEADFNRFQFSELKEAGFSENEIEETEAKLKLQTNAEGIKTVLSKVYFDLKESETPLVQQLKILGNQLSAFSSYHPDMN
ncbi:MAG: AAA family ATPase, partial [Bacteroidetes bacterium]|nr:AAA family ATPase [Bacteroidota bacterium]